MKKLLATLAVTTALIGGSLLAAPAATAASGTQLDYTDPTATGCATGAVVVRTMNMIDHTTGKALGRIDLAYSAKCSTMWLRVYGYRAGILHVGTLRKDPGKPLMYASVKNAGLAYTGQFYVPVPGAVDATWSLSRLVGDVRPFDTGSFRYLRIPK